MKFPPFSHYTINSGISGPNLCYFSYLCYTELTIEITFRKDEYSLLLDLKKRADGPLRRFFMRKNNFNNVISTNSILSLANLSIKGGVKDLSPNFDEYLYS